MNSSTSSAPNSPCVLTFLLTLFRGFRICHHYNPSLANIRYSLLVFYFLGTLSHNLAQSPLQTSDENTLIFPPSTNQPPAIRTQSLTFSPLAVGGGSSASQSTCPLCLCTALLPSRAALLLPRLHQQFLSAVLPEPACALLRSCLYKTNISLLSLSSFPLYPISLRPFYPSTTPLKSWLSPFKFSPHPVPSGSAGSQDQW